MSSAEQTKSEMSWARRGEIALKEAVAKAIADHARTGDPIVVWRDGRVAHVPATQAAVAEKETKYNSPDGEPDPAPRES